MSTCRPRPSSPRPSCCAGGARMRSRCPRRLPGAPRPRASRGRSRAPPAPRASGRATTRSRLVRARRCAGTSRRPTRSSVRAASSRTGAAAPRAPARDARAQLRRRSRPSLSSEPSRGPSAPGSSSPRRARLPASGIPARSTSHAAELQIALDLASGLTTREAAAKLYLSPKTVEFHLRRVYRKLGIGSRGRARRSVRAGRDRVNRTRRIIGRRAGRRVSPGAAAWTRFG